ncbi:N-carbamoyl-D-amino-acid hydrolase [Cupriavidus sp. USMAA2-4]|uniref:N-carbamoyl-D-amino-acid hydrolase n=1 Tax=Cupriavidus malaysiensis TaxID=367825 RepID=A0ABN4TJ46_9BURK|nr:MULTISPECIES: N-carbamoyl-D-amino-acid hydrolase [Cupriavidus]AOY92127.1 N-carbamoyl-D-amino-acid hydrolase [Cupriavidus sp. USMAA2-4]AOY98315.1 N-carbamoyl-D-amino-acid hydrolase [Cupriavidus sp. USMAHM13]AOZ04746.1 N-carbamoyl-D-amino-acid hydrolase [Cupriavidus malaysiensis]
MTRIVNLALGQLGPIARADSRAQVVKRLCALMREAHASGAHLIVYPELALTTFFPRWYIEDEAELDSFFEREMPGPDTLPLFELSRELGVGFYLGYAELAEEGGRRQRYNTSILVDRGGRIVGRYRKVHLPGHREHEPWRRFQHLEKRYFTAGDGFGVNEAFGGKVGMALCNDRRWPETYRVMGLQGVEMVLIGYNTPVHNAPAPAHDDLSLFHNQLSLQAGAYQNGTWVAGVAKAGMEEGVDSIGGSCVVAPSGEVVARCVTKDDELALARCDLDFCAVYKRTTFNFDLHRQPHAYGMIVARKGETLMADGSAVAG